MSDVDYLLKILILGDSSVGKSCLLLKFCDDKFNLAHNPTIGIDFRAKNIKKDGKNIKVQLWDTAGQERFRTITNTLYQGVVGIALVYGVDNRSSYQNIENWMKQIKQHVNEDVAIILIANKSDLETKNVDKSEGEHLANLHKIQFFETSAKTGSNVENAFMSLTQTILETLNNKPIIKTVDNSSKKLTPTESKQTNKKSSGCC